MRNVIVTGASRVEPGDHRRARAASGCQVIAIARSQSAPLGGRDRCGEVRSGAIRFRAFDLLQTHAIAALVSGLRREFGPLYGLVNNAGLGTSGVLAMMRDEQIAGPGAPQHGLPAAADQVRGALDDERAQWPHHQHGLRGRRHRLSRLCRSTRPPRPPCIGFTRSLAREVGPLWHHRERGGARLHRHRDDARTWRAPSASRSCAASALLRRLADVDDVAAAVEFLLSDKAKNITGTTLTVDAGNTA